MNESIYKTIREYFSTQPIDKAWIFGSYSRGEANDNSDIDILVRFTPGTTIGLIRYSRIIREISKLLGMNVDIVEEGSLLPFAEKSAEKDKFLIYERKAA